MDLVQNILSKASMVNLTVLLCLLLGQAAAAAQFTCNTLSNAPNGVRSLQTQQIHDSTFTKRVFENVEYRCLSLDVQNQNQFSTGIKFTTFKTFYRKFFNALQNESSYGHPFYCPERRRSFFAQPQYSGVNLNTYMNSPTGTDDNFWTFKGAYLFGLPGRTGVRDGNPGYSQSYELLANMQSVHLSYIQSLSDQGLFYTGLDGDRILNLDETEGVLNQCQDRGGWKSAHAILLGGANGRDSVNVILADQAWLRSNYLNCSTCLRGPNNNYARKKHLMHLDEGPNNAMQDAYNPWSFHVSYTAPTISNTTTVNANSSNLTATLNRTAVCSQSAVAECDNYVESFKNNWDFNNVQSNGYSTMNYFVNNTRANALNGRWDEPLARGMHLHYPPENWGTSFEPTRALVRMQSLTTCC